MPPFLVVLGRNGAGKSNLFDALRFLSRLAAEPVVDATQHVRGDVPELSHRDADGKRDRVMRFAVEMLLNGSVIDAFGEKRRPEATRVRYELAIELREQEGSLRPFVVDESARELVPAQDRWRERFPEIAGRLSGPASGRALTFLTTEPGSGSPRFHLWANAPHEAGLLRQPDALIPASNATATVLSVTARATDFPTLFAVKRELESWSHLHLDPNALRRPDSFDDADVLAPDGSHLPNALHRISSATAAEDRPLGLLADISADLAGVISDVSGVQVDEDSRRRRREVEFRARGRSEPVSARVASDGTLRAAALLTAAYDPANSGLLCFEEPENGVYPQRLITLVQRLRSIVGRAVDRRAEDPSAPLTQLLMTSHSPAILRALEPVEGRWARSDAVFLTTVSRILPGR